ncbi:MAG: nucleotide exchange factor GrpE [Candidatus Lokiarchaeota archaeon]|nr:nucleotide exchange factor GrpE [Candidatus Lokiarchaeota archaeon]
MNESFNTILLRLNMTDEDSSKSKDKQENSNISTSLEKKEQYNDLSEEKLIEKLLDTDKKLSLAKKELIQSKEEKKNWQEKYTRLQAEFENTQKRWEKSKDQLKNQSKGNIIKNFLPLYDSFKHALKNEAEHHILEQFFKQFMNILKNLGVEIMIINEKEIFDYNKHEAITTMQNNDLPNNTIIEVIQDGIKLDKDILRYAKVIVSQKQKLNNNNESSKEEQLKE